MEEKFVHYTCNDAIASIKLNRPERLNALSPQIITQLNECLDHCIHDEVRVVVLYGEGRSFCAGYDLKLKGDDTIETRYTLDAIQDITRKIRKSKAVFITAIWGHALGAGCEIALATDLIIAADDAQLGFPETQVGLSVTNGVSKLLPLIIGLQRAKDLILTGRRISATEAHEIGMITRAVQRDQVLPEALALADKLSAYPDDALALAKNLIDRAISVSLEDALQNEIDASLITYLEGTAEKANVTFESR